MLARVLALFFPSLLVESPKCAPSNRVALPIYSNNCERSLSGKLRVRLQGGMDQYE